MASLQKKIEPVCCCASGPFLASNLQSSPERGTMPHVNLQAMKVCTCAKVAMDSAQGLPSLVDVLIEIAEDC